ncbi:MAG TPA: hypothetical protein VKU91_04495 [Acidimicrobiales bacterium]|nr:hypothetical protein [Acidimicrobiales bacterium]
MAVVVTYRRPRLATAVVRQLVDAEGFGPDQVVLVVNGEGGLTDAALERSVHTLRMPVNRGPAGGFHAGLQAAFAQPSTTWAYLCEDDVGLFDLPAPRVQRVLDEAERFQGGRVGAVVAYGRSLNRRSGATLPYYPAAGQRALEPVDAAAWGATLVSRQVVESGVLPDPDLFFGYEDFDFFYALREAGFLLLVDTETARAVAANMSLGGRDEALSGQRPTDADEGWRAYYVARNFFPLARRHGRRRWLAWHLLYSLRRMQLSPAKDQRIATMMGLWDGMRGRLGVNPRYTRQVGEWSGAPGP